MRNRLSFAILLLSALPLLDGCIVYSYRKMPDGTTERPHVRIDEMAGEYKSDLNVIQPDCAQYFPALANLLGLVHENASVKDKTTYRTQYVRIVPEHDNLRLQALDKDHAIVAERLLVNGKDFKKVSGGIALRQPKTNHKSPQQSIGLTNNRDLVLHETKSNMGFFVIVPVATKDKSFIIYPRVPVTSPPRP